MAEKIVPLPARIQVVQPHRWDRRRREPRYHCGPATLGQVQIVNPAETRRGWVVDLSTNGVGLLLQQPLQPDTLLVLFVRSTAGDRRYELCARVVHAATQMHGDWLIGCCFDEPLTPDDLDALL